MQQPSMQEVEQLIRARKTELGDIDGLLLGELAKQKMLRELMQGEVGAEGSQTSEENTDQSNFSDSYVSESSVNSQSVLGEIDKLNLFSKYYRIAHGLPEKQQQEQAYVKEEEEKEHNFANNVTVLAATRRERRAQPSTKKLHFKERSSHFEKEKKEQDEIELKEITEEEMRGKFEMHRQTMDKFNHRQRQLDELVTLKLSWREDALKQERLIIRQQLIEEQKQKESLNSNKKATPTSSLNSYSCNLLHESVQEDSSILKQSRNATFRGILCDFKKANKRSTQLHSKIRDSSSFLR